MEKVLEIAIGQGFVCPNLLVGFVKVKKGSKVIIKNLERHILKSMLLNL